MTNLRENSAFNPTWILAILLFLSSLIGQLFNVDVDERKTRSNGSQAAGADEATDGRFHGAGFVTPK